MAANTICIAPGCKSTNKDPGLTFHQLPKNIEIRNQWLINMGPPTRKVFERSKLCSLHFDNDCYEHSRQILRAIEAKNVPGPNRLKHGAIPTIFGTRKRNYSYLSELGNLAEPVTKISATVPNVAMKSVLIQTESDKIKMEHKKCQTCLGINDGKQMVDKSCQTLPLQSILDSYSDNDTVHYDFDEELDEEIEDDGAKRDPLDICFTPSEIPEEDIFVSREFDGDLDPLQDRKFIVFEAAILQLFKFCFQCLAVCSISTSVNGTCLIVGASCPNNHKFEWKSQPYIGRKPAGNILTAAAILFSGMNPSKALRMLSFVGVQMYERTTFFRIQKAYLFRAITHVWKQDQTLLLQSLRGKPLTLGGDARMDSPGFCAKYGCYSFLENSLKKVIHIVLIQSNQVKNSVAMELEGCVRGLKFFIENQKLNVVCMVTDRHVQIRAYLRKKFPNIKHLFDCWHLVKSIKSKLAKISKTKGCEIISQWNRSIQNHIYWIANSSSGDIDLMRAKWVSLLRHIINKHEGHEAPFEKCSHDSILPSDPIKLWLHPLSDVYEKLTKMVKAYTKDIGFISATAQTSSVEAFHSVVINFAPKNTHYSFRGMYCRLILAVLHYNENADRIQAKTKSGTRRWAVYFPKFKAGEPSLRPIMVGSTYEYVTRLMKVACEFSVESINEGNEKSRLELEDSPPPLCSTFIHPDKEVAIENYIKCRRFGPSI